MGVKVITDSISDISRETAEKYGIEVLPIKFLINNVFISAYDLDIDEMMKAIIAKKRTPEIKGVSSDEYARTFGEYVSQGIDIVCITTGSTTVSNYSSACHASTKFPDANIYIIDSHQISTSIGTMAISAVDMANSGDSASMIAKKIEGNMHKFKQFGLADTVDFLQYSGYCPKIVAFGSNLLHSKFEFSIHNDQKFNVKMLGNSMSKALPTFFNNIFQNLRTIKAKRIFLMYTVTDQDYFQKLYKKIVALSYFEDIVVCEASRHSTSLYGNNGISVAYELK